MRPDAGHIFIGGQQLDQLDDDDRASLRAERIGFVLQSDNLIPFLSAVENVGLAMGFTTGRRSTARARELLSELGLMHRMDHLPRQPSGGESQRVAIAVAMANELDLLLADEVVGQLDSTTAAGLMEMIFTASRQRKSPSYTSLTMSSSPAGRTVRCASPITRSSRHEHRRLERADLVPALDDHHARSTRARLGSPVWVTP